MDGFGIRRNAHRVRRAAAIAIVLCLVGAGQASAAWEQPVGGPSPINRSATAYSQAPSILAIDGVPYVAWDEFDGSKAKIRVARLNAAGTAWERLGETLNPVAPINQSASQNAYDSSLAAVAGVPYVAWGEGDGVSTKIRVARLNADGSGWEKVGATLDPNSPINQTASRSGFEPSLITIGSVPYVAWAEDDGVNDEIRVARLNSAGTGWEKVGQTLAPASPINQSSTQSSTDPSLAELNGVPYVAWSESDGSNYEIRAARLNAAGTGWEKVINASSPINQSNGHDGDDPSLSVINGSLYIAWSEDDGVNQEIRVARLNSTQTAWEKVGQATNPASPLNVAPDRDAIDPGLVGVDGGPYVSWRERTALGLEMRVARLSADGTAWERVADAASPINEVPGEDGYRGSIAAVNGVPYVAWAEEDTSGAETRVARLEPELIAQNAAAGHDSATLSATWRTYGLAYPLGFDYGPALESSTTAIPATTGVDETTVSQGVSGLTPQTAYQVRPFALAGVPAPRVLGSVGAFSTTPPPPDTTPPETRITKDPKNKLKKSKAKYRFISTEPNSTFVCKFDKKKRKPCDAGKAKYKRLDDGKHKFKVYAVDAAGNRDRSPAKDKFKVV